jgi:hypothetical protein
MSSELYNVTLLKWVKGLIKAEVDLLWKLDGNNYPRGRVYIDDATPPEHVTVEAWVKQDDGRVLTSRRHVRLP